jgi:Ca-activated chloride channel family protein
LTHIDLTLTPRRAAVIEGADTELDVLVSVSAPDTPALSRSRMPLNLAIVIDRSGSMAGTPLAEAKRCAGYILEHLSMRDRVALVTFDSAVTVLAPSTIPEPKEPLLRAVRSIVSGGQTALHEGWLQGAEQAAPHVVQGSIARVLLLTDGQANIGESRPAMLAADCARLAAAGVSTSTYGLGQGFREELLGAMADAGGGQAYYGETAEDLMDPFREEFDLLSAVCGRRMRLRIEPSPGVSVTVRNTYRTDPDGNAILPDLAYGAAAWALLRVKVPAALQEAEPGRILHVLSAFVTYQDGEGRPQSSRTAHLRLPRMPQAAFAALPEDELTASRALELRSADLLTEARAAADRDDWDLVEKILARARAQAGDNEWVARSIEELQKYALLRDPRFSKEAYFLARKKNLRLAEPGEDGPYSLLEETLKPGYVRRKLRQGKDLRGEPFGS